MNSYLNNDLKIFKFLTPKEQKEILNRLEEDFKKDRSAKMPSFPKENSVEQYIQEKNAGAALSDLPYDKWKKL